MKKFYLCSLLALGVIACTHDFVEPQTPQEAEELTLLTRSDDGSTTPSNGDGFVLGQKLNNPYSVENMNNTVQGLYGPVDFFDPTHYYVRFLPQDSLDYNILLSDTTLILFDYPLDYEITQYGDYYHDPSIPEDEITWQYTVVPVNYQFPQMQYEILEECYIPYDDFEPSDYGAEMSSINSNTSINGVSGTNSNMAINIDFAELERQAFINSGNGDLLLSQQPLTRANKTRPWGTVHICDNSNDVLTMEPLRGATITTRVFVKIGRDDTDGYGEFEINKAYSARPEYVIRFTNSNIKIVKLIGEMKKDLGKHDASPKSIGIFANNTQKVNISSLFDISVVDNKAWTAGTILNAVYKYYTSCELLNVPPPLGQIRLLLTDALRMTNGYGAPMLSRTINHLENLNMLKQYLRDNSQWGAAIGVQLISAFNNLLPDIYAPYSSSNTTTKSIAKSIFHELSHASHYRKVKERYWAKYIDEIIYNFIQDNDNSYGTQGNSPHCGVGEMWAGYFEKTLLSMHYDYNYPNVLYDPVAFWNIGWIRPQFLYNIASLYNLAPEDIFNLIYSNSETINTIEKLRDNIIQNIAWGPDTDIAQYIRFMFEQYYGTYTSEYRFHNTSPMARYLKFKLSDADTDTMVFVDAYSNVRIHFAKVSDLLDNVADPVFVFENMAVYDTNVMNMALVSYSPNSVWGNNHFFDDYSWSYNFDTLNKNYIFTYETVY